MPNPELIAGWCGCSPFGIDWAGGADAELRNDSIPVPV